MSSKDDYRHFECSCKACRPIIAMSLLCGSCYIYVFFPSGMAGYDARTEYPKIAAWLERVRQDLNPHYDEAHSIVNKIAARSAKL
jgi:hypothetical protein